VPLSAGHRLGPYEIVSPLGEGGMGEVYRAKDTRLGREVAVKVLADRLANDDGLSERFIREARAIAALSHPNILAIHDVGTASGFAYSVTELLEGETLRERLVTGGMPVRKATETAIQIAEGLSAAHEHGIVHRDLKPENVFVTRDGRVKILDFGLARMDRVGSSDTTLEMKTQPGTVMGTVGYMSPEQVRGMAADQRSDIFSLGALLYEMLTGRRAFRKETAAETMTAILHEDPPELSRIGKMAPELLDVIAHCLEKRCEERFQTARDLAFALRVADREERSGSSHPTRPALATPAPGAAIAVLPFRNLSAEAENEYLSDGITEEIIGALTRIETLRVASRTSSFAFKDKSEDVRSIGERLGVTTVLEGSLRRAGNRIRVAAQLVDVDSGYQLWSERYDRQMEDVFDLQDELARAIAGALKVRLVGPEDGPLVEPATENVDAYNHYLRGRYHFNRREPKSAISEFESALSLDASYVPALTGLADSYCVYGFYGGIDTRVAFAQARSAADRAAEVEPASPDAHISLGLVEHYFGWDLPRLLREHGAAIELSPGSAAAHSWYSLGLSTRQRGAEGREHAREACRLEPFSANFQANVGWSYYADGDGDIPRALTEFKRALSIDPDALYPLWSSALMQHLLGAHEDAVSTIERALALSGGRQSWYVGLQGAFLAGAGRREEALAIRRSLEERASTEYVAPFHVLPLLVALGDMDAAIDAYARALDERNALAYWTDHAFYAPLRNDPRFSELRARLAAA
jgi:eukaryotic-like serine/threonine-protein kinase